MQRSETTDSETHYYKHYLYFSFTLTVTIQLPEFNAMLLIKTPETSPPAQQEEMCSLFTKTPGVFLFSVTIVLDLCSVLCVAEATQSWYLYVEIYNFPSNILTVH